MDLLTVTLAPAVVGLAIAIWHTVTYAPMRDGIRRLVIVLTLGLLLLWMRAIAR